MKKRQQLFWPLAYYFSTGIIISLSVGSITLFQTETTHQIIRLSAKFGMLMLAYMFSSKNLVIAHGKSKTKSMAFFKQQLRFQREQGLIAFNAFFLHGLTTFALYNIKEAQPIETYIYIAFTAIIPTLLMGYLYLTSFKPIQNRFRGWKKSHSFGWLVFGSVVAHELLLNQKVELTTIIAIGASVGTLIYGLIKSWMNTRSLRQFIITVSGFLLIFLMFASNSVIGKILLHKTENEPQEDTNKQDAVAAQSTVVTPQAPVVENTSMYKDGVYSGNGRGYGGTLNVEVIINQGKITTITVIDHNETPRFYKNAYPAIPDAIIKKQSVEVTAMSGATRSSEGIKQAVKVALAKAK